MEAATVAWHHMGWTPVGFSEIESFPSQILKHHYPTIPNYGDLTKFKEWNIQPSSVDLLVGGTPCQAFSVAGLRKGLDDPRGNLALTFLALADHLRPKYILWENVPGVLSSNKGEDFASFISALAELGYGFAWRVCDAQYFGVPQRRKRVFLLAIEGAGNWRTAAEILFERKSLCGDIEESDKKGERVAPDAGASVETSGKLFDMQAIGQYGDSGVASTCKQRDYKDATDLVVPTVLDRAAFNQGENAQYEPLIEQSETCPTLVSRGPHAVQVVSPTITTCKGSKGGSSDEAIEEITAIHNAQIKPLMFKVRGGSETNTGEQGGVIGQSAGKGYLGSEDKTFTIATTQDQWLAVPEPLAIVTHQSVSDIAPTIGASGPPYSRTGNERVEAEALAITFQPGNLRRNAGADPSTTTTTTLKASSGDQVPHVAYPVDLRNATRSPDKHDAMNRQGSGLGNDGDPSPTLTKEFVPGVAQVQGVDLYNQALTGDLHCSLRTAGGHGAPAVMAFDAFNQTVSETSQTLSCSASDVNHTGAVYSPTMAVRRLTPVECERLQGFCDNYSRIPWKGKPASECPDGPRYKACGNSMAVPVMRWIGERIQKYIDGTLNK